MTIKANPPSLPIFILLAVFFGLCGAAQVPAQVASQASSQDGLQLLHKMQTALGGADKIAAIRDYEETVRAQDWVGAAMGEVRKRTRWMRNPNLLRVDQIGPRNTYVLYFDGGSGSGWEILPDTKSPDKFRTAGEAIALVDGELKFAERYLSSFDLTLWMADRSPRYVVTSPAPNVVRIADDGAATDITLDPATWLPAKSASVSLADPSRPVAQEMRFEEWTEVSAVRFPAKRANYHNGAKMGEITEAQTIRINEGLTAEELATKPADFAPEMPNR